MAPRTLLRARCPHCCRVVPTVVGGPGLHRRYRKHQVGPGFRTTCKGSRQLLPAGVVLVTSVTR